MNYPDYYTEKLGDRPLNIFLPYGEGAVSMKINYETAREIHNGTLPVAELGRYVKDVLHAHFTGPGSAVA